MDRDTKPEQKNGKDGNEKVTAHLRLIGRVQGVAFRYYARNMANQLELKGWIKNMHNEEVEVMIEGKQDAVKQMIAWCQKGPSLALVEDIVIDWLPYKGEFNQFIIRS